MRTARSSSRMVGGLHQAPPSPRSRQSPSRHLPGAGNLPPGSRHPPGAGTPQDQTLPGPGTPPVNRITNRCKSITLPQTSFAGGKNIKWFDCINFALKKFCGTVASGVRYQWIS